MARSPFGPSGVSARWPYLGGVVGARAATGVPPPGVGPPSRPDVCARPRGTRPLTSTRSGRPPWG
eukprot:14781282-Alexandrium_andersonii.AAC.1